MRPTKLFLMAAMLCFICTALSGCTYFAPVMPPTGFLFSCVSAPIDTDADSTPVSTKVGESSAVTVLWLFSFGNAGLDSAAREGNLKTIEYIDYTYLNVLGFFQQFTTRVYGQ